MERKILLVAIHLFSINVLLCQVTVKPGIDFHFFEDNLGYKESKFQWRPNLAIQYKLNHFSVNFRLSTYAIPTAHTPTWDLERFELNRFIDLRYQLGKNKLGAGYYNRFNSSIDNFFGVFTDFKEYGGYFIFEGNLLNLNYGIYLKLHLKRYYIVTSPGHQIHISLTSGDKALKSNPEYYKTLYFINGVMVNTNFTNDFRKKNGISFTAKLGLKYYNKKFKASIFIIKSRDIYLKHTYNEATTIGGDTIQFGSVVNHSAWSNILGVNWETPLLISNRKISLGLGYYLQTIDMIDNSKYIFQGYNTVIKSDGVQASVNFPVSDITYIQVYKNFPFDMKELRENDVGFFSNLHLGLLLEL